MWKDWHPPKGSAEWTAPRYRHWTRGSRYCTNSTAHALPAANSLLSLLYNIHFNATLEGGSMAGQPREVAVLLHSPALVSLKTHVNAVQIL